MKKVIICISLVAIVIAICLAIFDWKKNDNIIDTNTDNFLSSTEDALMYIDNIIEEDSMLMINGTIYSGTLKKNDEISIVGLNKKGIDVKISKIEANNEEKESAQAGENVNLILDSDYSAEYIEKGQAVIAIGTAKPIYNITAKISDMNIELTELTEEANVFCINTDIKCNVSIMSEEDNIIEISLDVPIVVKKDLNVTLKNNSDIIATAIIVED